MTAELRIRVTGDTKDAQNALKAISANVGFQAISLGAREIGSSLNLMAKAAREDEVSVAQLRQAVDNTGASFGSYSKQLDETIDKGMELGFTDDQTRRSLALLTQQTGDAAEAQRRFALAQDLSRGANIDLEVASRLLGKVTEENVSVLQRYGISIEKGASQTELFAKIQERFGGQAEAFGKTNEAAAQRASIAYGELQEKMGAKLVPVLNEAFEGFTSLPEPVQLGGVALAKFGPEVAQTTIGLLAMGPALGNVVRLLPTLGAAALAAGPLVLGLAAAFTAAYAASKIFGDSTPQWAQDIALLGDSTLKLAALEDRLTTATGLERQAIEAAIEKHKENVEQKGRVADMTAELTKKTNAYTTAVQNEVLALADLNKGLSITEQLTRDMNLAMVSSVEGVLGLGQAMNEIDWNQVQRLVDAADQGVAQRAAEFVSPESQPHEGFDSGGVIPGPLGAPRLILAHAGETVLPTHRAGATGGITFPNAVFHFHGVQNVRQFMQEMQRETLSAAQAVGL